MLQSSAPTRGPGLRDTTRTEDVSASLELSVRSLHQAQEGLHSKVAPEDKRMNS